MQPMHKILHVSFGLEIRVTYPTNPDWRRRVKHSSAS